MDFEKEIENMQNSGDFLKLSAGKHKILFLSEPEFKEVTFKEEDGAQKRVSFDVEFEGKKYTWEISRGLTTQSLWGQIALIGKDKGSLKDQEINVIARGEGKKMVYTVEEAVELQIALDQSKTTEETVN